MIPDLLFLSILLGLEGLDGKKLRIARSKRDTTL
jgi:hypothetical protein